MSIGATTTAYTTVSKKIPCLDFGKDYGKREENSSLSFGLAIIMNPYVCIYVLALKPNSESERERLVSPNYYSHC